MLIRPLWADSLGAKSYSVYVEAGGVRLVIDPGVAAMHRGYPASPELKARWRDEAYHVIAEHLKRATHVVITHYHHDHYLWREEDAELYRGKVLYVKDPNSYINDSQRGRAHEFMALLIKRLVGEDPGSYLVRPPGRSYEDPVERCREALSIDLGEYRERREELLRKGREWFEGRVAVWRSKPWYRELTSPEVSISFCDGREVTLGGLLLRFTPPLCHGVEYARVGWVVALTLEYAGDKVVYTSDLQGPVIEDYATWIIRENPRVLVLDGPPTYLIPYSMSMYNLRRTVANLVRIIESAGRLEKVIYDHHLTRDRRYRERVREVYTAAREQGVEVLTVAEYLGEKSAFEQLGIET